MNVLIYESIHAIRLRLMNLFFQDGWKPSSAGDPAEAKTKALADHYDLILFDCRLAAGNVEPEPLAALKEILAAKKEARVLVHTVSPARILLQDLLQKGVSGVLLKPFDPDRFRKQLGFYLTRLKLSEPEKRQYLRVEPHPQDKCTVVIRDPESFRLLTGKIINLSQGGAAVEIFGNEPLSELAPNARLKNVQIFLRKESLKSDCALVLRRGKQLGLKFVNMAQEDRDALSQYLFYALQMKIA